MDSFEGWVGEGVGEGAKRGWKGVGRGLKGGGDFCPLATHTEREMAYIVDSLSNLLVTLPSKLCIIIM